MVLTGYPVEDLAFRSSLHRASRRQRGARHAPRRRGFRRRRRRRRLSRPGRGRPRSGVRRRAPQERVAVLHRGAVVTRQAKHHLLELRRRRRDPQLRAGRHDQRRPGARCRCRIAICEDLWQDGPTAAAAAADAGAAHRAERLAVRAQQGRRPARPLRRRAPRQTARSPTSTSSGGRMSWSLTATRLSSTRDGDVIARAGQFESELLVVDLDLPAATDDADPTRSGVSRSSALICRPMSFEAYEPLPARGVDAARRPRRDLLRAGPRAARLRAQERLPLRADGTVRRHRLDAGRYHRLRRAGRRERLRRLQPERLVHRALQDRRRRARPPYRAPPRHRADRADGRGLPEGRCDLDGLAEENLQARIRAVVWMGLSNQHGHLVLACGNKSELATGYSTIYGDAVGGTRRSKTCPRRWSGSSRAGATRTPPSARRAAADPREHDQQAAVGRAAPGQLDTDSLPPYDLLDAVLDDYVEARPRARPT